MRYMLVIVCMCLCATVFSCFNVCMFVYVTRWVSFLLCACVLSCYLKCDTRDKFDLDHINVETNIFLPQDRKELLPTLSGDIMSHHLFTVVYLLGYVHPLNCSKAKI